MRRVWLIIALGFAIPANNPVQARTRARAIWPEYFGTGNVRCSGRGLVAQGFSGQMNRSTEIQFIGKVINNNLTFLIYYYYWINYETLHGHHRVLILKSNCEYIGSYIYDGERLRTSGSKIIVDVPKSWGNVIPFRNGHPPQQAWFAGKNPNLIR
jgi:hypothetical protein